MSPANQIDDRRNSSGDHDNPIAINREIKQITNNQDNRGIYAIGMPVLPIPCPFRIYPVLHGRQKLEVRFPHKRIDLPNDNKKTNLDADFKQV